MSDYPVPFPMPPDSGLNSWQIILKEEIAWMQTNRIPYEWTNHWGSIGRHEHKGPNDEKAQMVLDKSPASYCCGATGELFLRAWKRFMADFPADDISAEQMRKLVRHYFFRRMDLGQEYLKGAAAGLQWLAAESPWLKVQTTEDASQMPFGTFLQMDFDNGSGKSGHSAVVVGHGTLENRPVLYVWSSNKDYSSKSEYSRGQPDGHGFDFYFKDVASRRFYGAWIQP